MNQNRYSNLIVHTRDLNDLSDLISKEGAAYIVANELGVKMFEDFVNKQYLNILYKLLFLQHH